MSGSSPPLMHAEQATPRTAADEATPRAFQFSDLSGYSFQQRLTIRAVSRGMKAFLNALAHTIRFEFEGREHWESATHGDRLPIYSFWHDCIALATHVFRRRNIVVMTSQSLDGEYIARCIQRFGYGVVRGSSTRGGIGALIEMIRLVRQGYPAAFTVDGPKGPRHVAKMGPVLLAKKTGQPILPFACVASRSWTLGSWDRMSVPKPFSRALVVFAPPITVEPDADESMLESKRGELQASLDALEQRGQQWRTTQNARSWWRRSSVATNTTMCP